MKNLFALSLFAIMLFASCEKDDPVIPNEEEVITTLSYTLTPTSGAPVVFSFQDLDGDDGNPAVVTNGTLVANTTYSGSIMLLNEQESPTENITVEVSEEDDEHQLFYQSTLSNLQIAYSDQDADGNPVGLSTTLTTGDAESGMLTIILRHKPIKTATGVAQGDITNAGGDTDIQVTFTVDVQ